MTIKSTLKRVAKDAGAYVLSGALTIGAAQYANAQTTDSYNWTNKIYHLFSGSSKPQNKPLSKKYVPKKSIGKSSSSNEIIPTGYLTTAGDGVFAKSYVNDIEVSPNSIYFLNGEWKSKDVLNYSALDVRKGLNDVIRYYTKKHFSKGKKPTGEQKATLAYFRELYRKAGSNDKKSLKLLENVVRDGVINSETDNLYDNGQLALKEGLYMIKVATKKRSFPILVYFRQKTFEEIPKESELEKEVTDTSTAVAKSDTLKEITKYEEERFGKGDALTIEPDSSGLPKSQFAQPIDLVVHGDSAAIAPGYVLADTTLKTGEASDTTQKAEGIEEERGFRFGVKAGITSTEEAPVTLFANYPISKDLVLETFLEWNLRNGKSYFNSNSYNVPLRKDDYVNPTDRRKKINEEFISTEEAPHAKKLSPVEAGLALNYLATNWLEVGFGAGIQALREVSKTNRQSTVWVERNGVPFRGPDTIPGTATESTGTKTYPTFRTDLRLKPLKGLTLDLILKRTGFSRGKNQARLDMGVEF